MDKSKLDYEALSALLAYAVWFPDDYVKDVAEDAGLLGLPDDSPEYLRVLAQEGFNNFTSVDAVLSDHHAGAMMCAGFAMMEFDDE